MIYMFHTYMFTQENKKSVFIQSLVHEIYGRFIYNSQNLQNIQIFISWLINFLEYSIYIQWNNTQQFACLFITINNFIAS